MSESVDMPSSFPTRLPRAPWLTMALNLALIMTIFLTRERWAAWRIESSQPCHGIPAEVMALSSGAKRAVIPWDDWLVLWDVEASRQVTAFRAGFASYLAAFTPDGTRLLMTVMADEDTETTILVDARDGREVAMLEGSEGEDDASFSPDGRFILSKTELAHLIVWRTVDGSLALKVKPRYGEGFGPQEFSPDGSMILMGAEWAVNLLDACTGELRKRLLETDSPFKVAAFCAGGRNVIVWLGEEAVLVDAKSGNPVARTEAYAYGELSPDKNTMAALKREAGPVAIHDTETGRLIAEVPLVGARGLCFADGGKRLLVERREGWGDLPTILDARTGDITGEIPYDHMQPFKLSPDGSRILVGQRWAPARLYSARTGTLHAEWPEARPVGFLGNDRVMLDVNDEAGGPSMLRVLRRIRPEQWWGVLWLWHFWLIFALGVALAWSAWRDIRRMERRALRARREVGELGEVG